MVAPGSSKRMAIRHEATLPQFTAARAEVVGISTTEDAANLHAFPTIIRSCSCPMPAARRSSSTAPS